jgi:hypothetical protein
MEQGAKKLFKEREQLRQQIEKTNARIKAIDMALDIMELRQAHDPKFLEAEQSLEDVFRNSTLPQACETTFMIFDGWLDKNQMEYLLTIGGYPFDAKDPTNSVDVTLRRMAADGKCEMEKRGGSSNRYRAVRAT